MKWHLVFLLQFFLMSVPLAKADTLRSISEIKHLTLEEASKKIPVKLRAQVLKIGKSRFGFFMHDGKEGIYLSIRSNYKQHSEYEQGHIIEVEGVTHSGFFLPHIESHKITIIGKKPLPKAIQLTRDKLYDPKLDCQWVEVEGIVVATVHTNMVQSLRLKCFGEFVSIVLPHSEETEAWANQQINHRVKVRGVLATRFNKRQQMTGRLIHSQSPNDVSLTLLKAEELPLLPIDSLVRAGRAGLEGARIRGIITHAEGSKIYVQAGDSGLLIRTNLKKNWKIGQFIEVIGTVSVEPFRPSFYAEEISIIEEGKVIHPTPISPKEKPFPVAWHHSLIELEANLISKKNIKGSVVLNCSAFGNLFEARLSSDSGLVLEPGSTLRLRGICELRTKDWQAHTYKADGFSLVLRQPADILILTSPPWWTLHRVITVSGIITAVAFVAGLWVWLLKRKVNEQTSVIAAQVERETVVNERQRLARELHDSFEQNMSGLALQLETTEQRAQRGQDISPSLGLAKRILNHCIQESRESIYDLRHSSKNSPSSSWHDDLLLSEAESLNAKIHIISEGKEQSIDRTTKRHISKIVREASFNALRHGAAKEVQIRYQYHLNQMSVDVKDNGCGFDPDQPPPRGHFGILGMRERAKRIHGELAIESDSCTGTTVSLTLPLSS